MNHFFEKQQGKNALCFCEITLWQLKREAFVFNSSTNFTIEKYKSYFATPPVSLKLP